MIRVVSAVPVPMLQEVLCDQIARAPGFALIGKASDPRDLPALVAKTHADVVICLSTDSEEIPGDYRQLLSQFPQLLIVGVIADHDAVVLYRQEFSRRELPSVGFGCLFSEIRQTCEGQPVVDRGSLRGISGPNFGTAPRPLRFSLN